MNRHIRLESKREKVYEDTNTQYAKDQGEEMIGWICRMFQRKPGVPTVCEILSEYPWLDTDDASMMVDSIYFQQNGRN